MKIFDKLLALFEPANETPSLRDMDEREAARVFNTYYRVHLARHDPVFLDKIPAHAWYLDIIDGMSERYGLKVPARIDPIEQPCAYEQVQKVLIAIEAKNAGTAV